ncbi:prolipoprotein diacylglyceryl transferase [Bacteriovoracaceae bacterium]|nr:prolipoprotein diacylglyceryl transferase [Bacteriovoracaceae bacterium]
MLPYFKLGDSFILYSYPIMLGMALFASKHAFEKMLNTYEINLPQLRKNILIFSLISSCFVGAKILFILSQNAVPMEKLTLNPSFWLGGGLVYYGAPILSFFIILFFSKVFKIKFNKLLAAFLMAISIGHAFGRIGCFLAGCCFGDLFHLPVQMIESVYLFGLFIVLTKYFLKHPNKIIFIYFLFYPIFRFLIEFVRQDPIRGEVFNLSTSQFLSLLIIFLLLTYVKIFTRHLDRDQS